MKRFRSLLYINQSAPLFNRHLFLLLLLSGIGLIWSAPAARSADSYYRDAAFQFIQGRLPTAALTCEEGLRHHPDDTKLQMLKERIQENQDEQKKQCQNPQNNGDKDQNKDQNRNSDQQQDKQNQEDSGQGSSSDSGQGASSSSTGAQSNPEQNPDSANGGSSASAAPQLLPGELSPEQAEQLLREFNQQNGERKPWKPVRGRTRPEKDW